MAGHGKENVLLTATGAVYNRKYQSLIEAGKINETTACMLTGYENALKDNLSWSEEKDSGSGMAFRSALEGVTVHTPRDNPKPHGGGTVIFERRREGAVDWITTQHLPDNPWQFTKEVTHSKDRPLPENPANPQSGAGYKSLMETPVLGGRTPSGKSNSLHYSKDQERISDFARLIHEHTRPCPDLSS